MSLQKAYFNSRPSARGDVWGGGRIPTLYAHFNSRPSARGDVDRRRRLSMCLYFNSRPSARGDDRPLVVYVTGLFQFTPLREGRRRNKNEN